MADSLSILYNSKFYGAWQASNLERRYLLCSSMKQDSIQISGDSKFQYYLCTSHIYQHAQISIKLQPETEIQTSTNTPEKNKKKE